MITQPHAATSGSITVSTKTDCRYRTLATIVRTPPTKGARLVPNCPTVPAVCGRDQYRRTALQIMPTAETTYFERNSFLIQRRAVGG